MPDLVVESTSRRMLETTSDLLTHSFVPVLQPFFLPPLPSHRLIPFPSTPLLPLVRSININYGGKNRRRGKNENDDEKRELVFKEDGQGECMVDVG